MAKKRFIWLTGSVFLAAAATATGPHLTGLTREHGVDSAWLWFPDTAASLILQRGQDSGGYRLLEVDHSRGVARLATPAGELVLSFAAVSETPALPRDGSSSAIARRSAQNAARALGATVDDVPATDGTPATIDQIAAQARRRLHRTPTNVF